LFEDDDWEKLSDVVPTSENNKQKSSKKVKDEIKSDEVEKDNSHNSSLEEVETARSQRNKATEV
jgi:hypothetical protein